MANTIKETTAKLVEAGTAVRAELYAQSQTLDSANLATPPPPPSFCPLPIPILLVVFTGVCPI
jgi:hypothetical protein